MQYFELLFTDIEPPRIQSCPRDITLPAESRRSSRSRVGWTPPIARDNVLLLSLECDYASGSSFTLGRTEVTYTAKDKHGNSAECTFSVYITGMYINKIRTLLCSILNSKELGNSSTAFQDVLHVPSIQ